MVGLGRIAGGGPDSPVFLADQVLQIEDLVRGVAPELGADLAVQGLGQGLRQAVGQGGGEDGGVVVTVPAETLGHLDLTVPGGDGEAAQPVRRAADRGDEVGEGQVRPVAVAADHLLAQGVETTGDLRAGLIGIDEDVVALGVGRPESDRRLGGQPAALDHPVEHPPAVGIEVVGGLADDVILQDGREPSKELPAGEEGRPVDVLGEVRQVPVLEGPQAREGRPRRGVPAPVRGEGAPAGVGQAHPAPVVLAALELLADPGVLGRGLGGETVVLGGRKQGRDHAYRPAGVEDVGGGARGVGRGDLHRRVGLGGGGAADQQGHVEAPPLHLRGDEDHLVQARGDQARQADHVHLQAHGLVEDPVGRDHDAQVEDLVVVTLQDHADDVLADVVDVTLDGGHEDPAGALAFLAGALGLHEGQEPGHGLFHHPRGFHHLRQEHLARAE